MNVTNRTFYVAEVNDGMRLYDTKDEAIDHLKTEAPDPDQDDVAVSEVSVDGDDWTIKQMPWQQIALRLLQEA